MTAGGSLARLADRDGPLAAVLLGAAVTVVCSVIPFSPVVGGAVAAGRLQRGYAAGLGAAALSGLVAAVPLALLLVPAVWVAGALGVGIEPGGPAYGAFLAVLAALFLAYTVGLGALGGLLGVYAGRRTDRRLDPTEWL